MVINELIPVLHNLWSTGKLQRTKDVYNNSNWFNAVDISRNTGSVHFVFPVLNQGEFCLVFLVDDLMELLVYEHNFRYSHNKQQQIYPRDSTHEELFQLSTVQDGVIDFDNLCLIYEIYDSLRASYDNA